MAGPCVVTVDGPVLIIDSVTSGNPARSIQSVTLTDIKREGRILDFSYGVPYGMNLLVSGSGLGCTTPCGFESEPGAYTFRVSAPGFASREVVTAARYAVAQGPGCPLHLSGGTRVSVALDAM